MRIKLTHLFALILAALFGVPAFAQTATTPYPTSIWYASAFNLWSINSQQPNTYTFQGRSICNSSAQSQTFFVFNTNAPVYIADANSLESEVATPSAVVNTAGSCGVTLAPANTHNTFQLRSGTAGLQEALNSLSGQINYPTIVVLDQNWFTQALTIPGTTPGGIIRSVTCGTNVLLENITKGPAEFLACNSSGTGFTAIYAPTAGPFLRPTSYTAISAPTALSTSAATNGLIATATTGGSIPATSTYRLAATYIDGSGGETLISTDSASTATIVTGGTATNVITVTSPAAATGAIGWRLYMTAASGSAGTEILYTPTCSTSTTSVAVLSSYCPIGATATISAVVTGTATVPSIASAFPRSSGSSQSFPPFAAGGTVSTTATGTLGIINFPAYYFNTLGRSIEVCGNANVTTNSTTGTLTLKTLLASVPGVTSITPFTVTSGTTTASAQVPINFCITYTTAAVGTTGTLWVHGWANFVLNSGANTTATSAADTIFAVSSTVDLTKQDQLEIQFTPTTTGSTAFQLTQLSIIPLN